MRHQPSRHRLDKQLLTQVDQSLPGLPIIRGTPGHLSHMAGCALTRPEHHSGTVIVQAAGSEVDLLQAKSKKRKAGPVVDEQVRLDQKVRGGRLSR